MVCGSLRPIMDCSSHTYINYAQVHFLNAHVRIRGEDVHTILCSRKTITMLCVCVCVHCIYSIFQDMYLLLGFHQFWLWCMASPIALGPPSKLKFPCSPGWETQQVLLVIVLCVCVDEESWIDVAVYTSLMLSLPPGHRQRRRKWGVGWGERATGRERTRGKRLWMDLNVMAVCVCVWQGLSASAEGNSCNRWASGSLSHSGFYHTAYKPKAGDSQQ